MWAKPELVDQVVARAFAWLADDGQCDVALRAQLRHRLEQVREALERHVSGRCGDQPTRTPSNVRQRCEQIGIDADRHEAHPVQADSHVGVDVLDRVLADHDDARHAAGDAALHPHEVVPTADRVALAPCGRVSHLQGAIARDRMVQRDDRGDELLDAQDAVAEALVVVNQIEIALAGFQGHEGAHAECQRFPERSA